MKNLTLIAGAVFVLSLASCKKDYDCECTVAGQTSTTTFEDSKKSDAEDACDALSTSAAILGGSCDLN